MRIGELVSTYTSARKRHIKLVVHTYVHMSGDEHQRMCSGGEARESLHMHVLGTLKLGSNGCTHRMQMSSVDKGDLSSLCVYEDTFAFFFGDTLH